MATPISGIDKIAIGKRIGERLREIGLKKGDLAQRLDRDATRISSYLRGEDLTLELLGEMAGHLRCSVTWLIIGGEKQDEDRVNFLEMTTQTAVLNLLCTAIFLQRQLHMPDAQLLRDMQIQMRSVADLIKDLPAPDFSEAQELNMRPQGRDCGPFRSIC